MTTAQNTTTENAANSSHRKTAVPERTSMKLMKLVSVSHEQSRLNFFRDQLAAANRKLDWSMKHNPDRYDHSEKGEVVSFYEWAVKMAEKEVHSNES